MNFDLDETLRVIAAQLNHERVMLGPAGRLGALYDRVRDWACATRGPDGRPVARRPDVRNALAEVGASLRVNELLNWQVAVADTVEIADSSATKVFSSERVQRFGQLLADVVGRHGDPADEPTAELMTWLAGGNERGRGHGAGRRGGRADGSPDQVRGEAEPHRGGADPGRGGADHGARREHPAARSRPGEPADDRELGRGDRRRQPGLHRRGVRR